MADENEPTNVDSDDGWTLRVGQDIPATIIQGVIRKKPFHRGLPVKIGETPTRLTQLRRIEIPTGIDGLGDDFFTGPEDAPIIRSDFLDAVCVFDRANEGGRSLQTVEKDGASIIYHDTDADIIKRGGDPGHRIEQPDDSFAYKPGS